MIGISTSYFSAKGVSIYESVKRAYKLGFRLIELGGNHNFEENVFKILRKIKRDFPNVNFSLHGYFPPVFKPPTHINVAEGLTYQNKKMVLAMLRGAKVLRAGTISFHSGFNHQYKFSGFYKDFEGFKEFIPVKKIAPAKAYQNQKEFFKFAVEKAKKQETSVLMEVVYSKFMGEQTLNSQKAYLDFLKAIPSLGFLFDYAHAFIEFKNPDEFFRLQERIKEIHLSDVKKGEDHLVLGEGEIDLKNLVAKIKKLSFTPPIILEHAGGVKENDVLKEKRVLEEELSI